MNMRLKSNNTIKSLGLFAVCSLMAVACTGNFEDLNTHPTDLDPDKMTPTERIGALFPAMTYLLCPQHENESQMIDQIIFGQLGGYFTAPTVWDGTNIGTYNPSDKFMRGPFTDILPSFYSNYFEVEKSTQKSGFVYAWANILRAGCMIRVTDTFGPIPYSKIGGGQFEVEYDALETLYPQMINDLSDAITALTNYVATATDTPPIGEYDIMYNGDFSKWVKYANSLKFRMAVRIANVLPDFARTAMEEAMAGGMILTNSDNAFLPTGDNPFAKAGIEWGDLTINATLSTYMNGYSDPRRSIYMTRTNYYDYNGVRMGIEGKGKVTTTNYSKPNYSKDSPMPVFYAAESYFLMAEAALRGWISGGESAARNYYESGIRMSMEQWNVSIGSYLSNTASGKFDYTDRSSTPANGSGSIQNAPAISWSSANSEEEHLKQILTQKYIANYPIGLESWCDFRRTGYPEMIGALNNLSQGSELGTITDTRMVRRLRYPQQEYENNSANVKNAVNTHFGGRDEGSLDLWWAKKD